MSSVVVAVFRDRDAADRAVDALGKAGFRNDQIGVVTHDSRGKNVAHQQGEAETHAGSGAVAGLVAGAGIGGLVGLGVLAGVLPVIGPALAAGTLATILSNAAGGAALAGLGGALIGWGMPEEDAKYYEGELHSGQVVVTVHAEDRSEKAHAILMSNGGYNNKSQASAPSRM
jgi:hypothetical protein